jgi:hypothetical protein
MTRWKAISVRIGRMIQVWGGKKDLLKRPENMPPKTSFREDLREARRARIKAHKLTMMQDLYSRWRLGEIQITPEDLNVLKSMEWGPIIFSRLEQVYRKYL